MKPKNAIKQFENDAERDEWKQTLDIRMRQCCDTASAIADADAVVLALRDRKRRA